MRALGYSLITLGFLAGAYFAVRDPHTLPLVPFLAALVVGVAGIVMVRTAMARTATHAERLSADVASLEESLGRIAERAGELEAGRDAIDVYDLRHRIDELFPVELARFVEARQAIVHRFGLQAYADVMNPFSAGERYLNRVWSTSTDGYIDEAHEYLTRSREQFEEALAVLRGLGSAATGQAAAAGATPEPS